MPLVTADGFVHDRWRRVDDALDGAGLIVALDRLDEALASGITPLGVEIGADTDLNLLLKRLHSIALIAIRFDSFRDGRGFSVARRLRQLGYSGRLRATGSVIADQWAFLRDCGIDEALIDDSLATRQPESAWLQAATAISGSYQHRLAGTVRAEGAWHL